MYRYTPEQACAKIISYLREHLVYPVESIEAGGSVPLGTYVGEPDIDIFILCKRKQGIIRDLRMFFPYGMEKAPHSDDGLDIWFVPNLYGYPVDFVILDPDHIRIQTLEHTRYYMNIMTDELRERVKEIKRFFKRVNCYGAEVGGVTGICCTRLAELYPTAIEAVDTVVHNLYNRDYIVEDPTLPGRNLLASVTEHKRFNLVWNSMHCFPDVDLAYFFENYGMVYEIKRIKRIGTDREYQFITRCVRKAWAEIKHRIKNWNPHMRFDTLFTPNTVYVGVKIVPNEIKNDVEIKIERSKLNDVALLKLMKKYKVVHNTDYVRYYKPPPFTDVVREFEKGLYTRLAEVYIGVDRA